MSKNIITNKNLFFKRDNKNGGVILEDVTNPLQNFFSKLLSRGEQKKNNKKKNNFMKASQTKNISNTYSEKEGGYMTQLFFPGGYSTAASTLGLYALNKSIGNSRNKKQNKRKNKKQNKRK